MIFLFSYLASTLEDVSRFVNYELILLVDVYLICHSEILLSVLLRDYYCIFIFSVVVLGLRIGICLPKEDIIQILLQTILILIHLNFILLQDFWSMFWLFWIWWSLTHVDISMFFVLVVKSLCLLLLWFPIIPIKVRIFQQSFHLALFMLLHVCETIVLLYLR